MVAFFDRLKLFSTSKRGHVAILNQNYDVDIVLKNHDDMEKWSKLQYLEGYSGVEDWEISDNGNLRHKGSPIEPKVDSQGYPYVQLCFGGELVRVHKLVLLAFVGPPPSSFWLAIHDDGNRANNVLSNLWWGRRSDVKIRKAPKEVNFKTKKKRAPKGPRFGGHFDAWLNKKAN